MGNRGKLVFSHYGIPESFSQNGRKLGEREMHDLLALGSITLGGALFCTCFSRGMAQKSFSLKSAFLAIGALIGFSLLVVGMGLIGMISSY